jgi:peptidoglycan/LPS O-acetylase OafA/YrhL
MSPNPHLVYRPDIDGLRAIAILAVIGFHAFPNWVKGGFIGVDIFFVISGFLISTIIFKGLDQENFSFAAFYARRIKRIFPALALVFIACLIFGWFTLLTDEYKQLGHHILAGAVFSSNFRLLKEGGYFDTAAELKPLLHLWSLGIEEQFYIIWPPLLHLFWKRLPNILIAILCVALTSFALNIYLVNSRPVADFYLPFTRFWELLVGGMLAYISLNNKVQVYVPFSQIVFIPPKGMLHPNARAFVGALLIAVAISSLNTNNGFPGWWALLPTFGAVLLISAGPDAWFNRKVLAHRALVFVGLISYPLYLWHWPLLSFFRITSDNPPATSEILAIIFISFLGAWLTYKVVETPFRRSKSAWAIITLISMIVVSGVFGEVIRKSNGYPARFPSNIQKIIYSSSSNESYRKGVCLLNPDQEADSFSHECFTGASSQSKKILLWGDSHAAQLYAGLHHYEREGQFDVMQLTASACPPVINENTRCSGVNKKVTQLITNINPITVIMSGAWLLYDQSKGWDRLDTLKIVETINELKKLGVNEIILFGPVPVWDSTLPKILVKLSKSSNWQEPPDRLTSGFSKDTKIIDNKLEAIAKEVGISYISPYQTLCNLDGCLATIQGDPTAFDYGHLTVTGSIFLIGANLAILAKPIPRSAASSHY